jgi:hypothetical protein
MILFCLIKVSKINCFKEDKTTFKQAKNYFAPIKRKMDLNSKSIGLVLSVEVQKV